MKLYGLLPQPDRVGWIFGIGLRFLLQSAMAEDMSSALIQSPICSTATIDRPGLNGICAVTPLRNSHNEVSVDLTAEAAPIEVAGYKITTENYNGNYLTPIIEAMPGDTVAAHLVNILSRPRRTSPWSMEMADETPTNLHYFHGGIVSPNNARPKAVELGNGDNIYVHLKAGPHADVTSNSFEFEVPIPGEQMLDARVLEGTGYISHPVGLNWYHSHLHGISSDQVMGECSVCFRSEEPPPM